MLYVGCRVRIKWSENWPELNGTEGVIVNKVDDELRDIAREIGVDIGDWDVSPDLWGSHVGPDGFIFTPASEQLEPILLDRIHEEEEEEELVYV